VDIEIQSVVDGGLKVAYRPCDLCGTHLALSSFSVRSVDDMPQELPFFIRHTQLPNNVQS
jgi:hypothetical protein